MLRFAIPFMLAAFTTARVFCKQTIEKRGLRAVQKRPDEAREKSTSGGVFTDTLKRGDQTK
jgi:hypothetical protein